jgi:hypothetical protein
VYSIRGGGALTVDFWQAALLFAVIAPGLAFSILAMLWLLGWSPAERLMSRLTAFTFSASIFSIVLLVWRLLSTGDSSVSVTFGNWFTVHDYRFPLVLVADRLSLPFLAMTAVLAGLIGEFSCYCTCSPLAPCSRLPPDPSTC